MSVVRRVQLYAHTSVQEPSEVMTNFVKSRLSPEVGKTLRRIMQRRRMREGKHDNVEKLGMNVPNIGERWWLCCRDLRHAT